LQRGAGGSRRLLYDVAHGDLPEDLLTA